MSEPPPIPSNAANLTPWTKSNFLAVGPRRTDAAAPLCQVRSRSHRRGRGKHPDRLGVHERSRHRRGQVRNRGTLWFVAGAVPRQSHHRRAHPRAPTIASPAGAPSRLTPARSATASPRRCAWPPSHFIDRNPLWVTGSAASAPSLGPKPPLPLPHTN